MNDVGSIVEKVKTGDESALRLLYDIFSPMMKTTTNLAHGCRPSPQTSRYGTWKRNSKTSLHHSQH